MTAYTFGMVCFSCSTDFENYINNATKVVTLAQVRAAATCADHRPRRRHTVASASAGDLRGHV